MKTLDIFCGGGGSSYGAQNGGADIVCGVDMWQLATTTFSSNFPNAKVFTRRLENIKIGEFRERVGKIDLLLASPECTNHTCAKGAAPRSEESRATAMQLIRFAKALMPRWIVMENVIQMRPWSRYSELKTRLEALGYRFQEQILDASEFGVPQRRRRLFVFGDLHGEPKKIVPPNGIVTKTVEDILDPPGTWDVTPLRKPGRAEDTIARANRAFKSLGKKARFLIVYYGSDGSGGWQPLDRPLRTITTVDRFALIEHDGRTPTMRMLQVSELQKAMGFGLDFQLPAGTRRDKVKVLGNGVCPPVMQAIVDSLQNSA